jgi:class 3 adenylate cyclase
MTREVIEAHLLSAGYEVLLAHNGERALALAQERPPDLVLLDVRMHGLSGYEVCERLKHSEATRYAPVVMVTALESESDKLQAINAGADDFISKPFTSLMLLTRVRSLLRIKRLHDELEERNRLLRRVLNRYVNADIASTILADPENNLKLGGETRPVTVLFADIRGFTTYAEQRDAAEVLALLNYFFNELTEVVFRCHGTFDKYIGDEIMAFFGAPVATGDDVFNAVAAALELRRVFAAVNTAADHPDTHHLGLGIGLHSGDAALGNVGSERVMSYTVIGDTVNMAHRLQELAGRDEIIVSAAVYRQVAGRVAAVRLEPQMIKGKREPQVLYRIDGLIET